MTFVLFIGTVGYCDLFPLLMGLKVIGYKINKTVSKCKDKKRFPVFC